MGRVGVSEYQVFAAAEQLLAEGANTSVDTVRAALGNTGSRTTINTYLKAWRERRANRESAGADLSGHLRQIITEQAELLSAALAAESETKLQEKSQEFAARLHLLELKNQELDLALAQSQSQLAEAQQTLENQKLQLLRKQSDITDLRDHNQSYREALAKEIGRRETLDHAIVEHDKHVAALRARGEALAESCAVKSAELQSLQQRDRDQRTLLKEKADEIKELKKQQKAVLAQHYKDIGRLSQSLTALTRPEKKKTPSKKIPAKAS